MILSFFLLYYFFINNNSNIIIQEKSKVNKVSNDNNSSTFTNVQYEFYDKNNNKFTLIGKNAFLNKNNSDQINLKIVDVFSQLRDGTILNIKSNEALFYRNKKDIFFKNNILITNNDKVIKAKYANFFFNKNLIEIFDDVIYQDKENFVRSDKVLFNTFTKNAEIKMNLKKDQVYGKRIK